MSEDNYMDDVSTIKKTTEKHFKLFEQTALNHIKRLGLYNWRIEFAHEEMDSYASADHNIENHCAKITLNKNWQEDGYKLTSENIKISARHEIHHLLLAKLAAYAHYRFVSKIQLDSAEEEIIRILDKFL